MSFTDNTPQANQTIASTQPLLLANNGLMKTNMQRDHAWACATGSNNIASQASGTHQQCQMPNSVSDPPMALGTGINGIYYVNGNLPKFYNGIPVYLATSASPSNTLTGSVALTSAATSNIFTVPAGSSGTFVIYQTSINNGFQARASGFIVSNNTNAQLINTNAIGWTGSGEPTFSGLTLQGRLNSPSLNATYKYVYNYVIP